MSSLSLDSFFKEKKGLANLDWLDIDPSEYDNMPFNDLPSYMAVPKLEEAWSHREDSNINLIPNQDLNFNQKTPQKDSAPDVQSLINFVKKQMMAGKTGKDLIEVVSKKVTPDIVKQAYSELEKLSKEQGLLGNVYIDPTLFSKCVEGSASLSKTTKTAKYVLAMDKCAGCAFNKSGRCEVYKKKVSTEIVYDQETLNFYSKHFSNLTGQDVVISSREELQKIFTYKPEIKERIAQNKPQENNEKDEKTLENKQQEYNQQLNDLKDSLNHLTEVKIGTEVSSLLIKGYNSHTIADHVKGKYSSEEFEKNKNIINSVLAKQGSFGRVFVEADLLPVDDSQDAYNITNVVRNLPNIKFIIIRPEQTNFQKMQEVCRKQNKTIVPSITNIPMSAWESEFNMYPKNITEKISSIFKENPVKGLRLAFIQKNIAKSEIKPVDNFEVKSSLDTTEYNPENKTIVSFSPSKIASALEKGYTLSSIILTGRKLGTQDTEISKNIKRAFESITSVHKYQMNVPFTLPENVKVILSQKDLNADLSKPLENIPAFAFNSANAPVDTNVNDYGIVTSDLYVKDIKEATSEDIEISSQGLGEFDI